MTNLEEVTEDESDAFLETQFAFPFRVGRITIHTVYASDDGHRWLHAWACSARGVGEPHGRLSNACLRPSAGGTEDGGWQCIAKEVFFHPEK